VKQVGFVDHKKRIAVVIARLPRLEAVSITSTNLKSYANAPFEELSRGLMAAQAKIRALHIRNCDVHGGALVTFLCSLTTTLKDLELFKIRAVIGDWDNLVSTISKLSLEKMDLIGLGFPTTQNSSMHLIAFLQQHHYQALHQSLRHPVTGKIQHYQIKASTLLAYGGLAVKAVIEKGQELRR